MAITKKQLRIILDNAIAPLNAEYQSRQIIFSYRLEENATSTAVWFDATLSPERVLHLEGFSIQQPELYPPNGACTILHIQQAAAQALQTMKARILPLDIVRRAIESVLQEERSEWVGFDFERPKRLVPLETTKYHYCQNYSHATDIAPCAIHLGSNCKGCTDYNPHPLSGVFDFSKASRVVVKRHRFVICSTLASWSGYIAPYCAWQAAIASALNRWYDEHPELPPTAIYFAGDREQYDNAIAHLGVDSLPHFIFDVYESQKIYLFYL